MLSRSLLLENGYRFFEAHVSEKGSGYLGVFEKCIQDEVGKKYFIHIKQHNFEGLMKNAPVGNKFTLDMQFNLPNENILNLSLHHNDNNTLEFIEEWCEKSWHHHEASYYERKDDA